MVDSPPKKGDSCRRRRLQRGNRVSSLRAIQQAKVVLPYEVLEVLVHLLKHTHLSSYLKKVESYETQLRGFLKVVHSLGYIALYSLAMITVLTTCLPGPFLEFVCTGSLPF